MGQTIPVASDAAGHPAGDHRVVVIVVGPDPTRARRLMTAFRERGMVTYRARTTKGCLRVATSVQPDLIVVEPKFPDRFARLLRCHPASASARLVRMI